MDGLFLLYGLTYFPLSGVYGPAINTATKAAFIQSGYAGEFEVVRSAAEKRIPPVIRHSAIVYTAVSKKEFSWRGRTLDGTVKRDGASLLLHVEW